MTSVSDMYRDVADLWSSTARWLVLLWILHSAMELVKSARNVSTRLECVLLALGWLFLVDKRFVSFLSAVVLYASLSIACHGQVDFEKLVRCMSPTGFWLKE